MSLCWCPNKANDALLSLLVRNDEFHAILGPTLGVWPSGFRNSRKEEVVLSRLRIGHTYFSHSYILRQEDPPECTACQEIYSVRHVLIGCIDLGLIRPRFYTVPDMKTLFDTVSVDRIVSFVKEVNLFTKIWGLLIVFLYSWVNFYSVGLYWL